MSSKTHQCQTKQSLMSSRLFWTACLTILWVFAAPFPPSVLSAHTDQEDLIGRVKLLLRELPYTAEGCLQSTIELPQKQREKHFFQCMETQENLQNFEKDNTLYTRGHGQKYATQDYDRQKRSALERQFSTYDASSPPQLNENILSALVNNPEAVWIVLNYLERQQKLTTTTTTTPAPRRRRPPPLSLLFGGSLPFAEALKQHRLKIQQKQKKQQAQKKIETRKPQQRPPPNVKVDNPKIMGQNTDLEYFGPKDFVPQSQHKLPFKLGKPMRLRYTTAEEFPHKYGLVPMPR